MKKIIKVVFVSFLLFMITGCTSPDGKKFKKEYEELNSVKQEDGTYKYTTLDIDANNPIKYLTIDEVFEFFDSGTGFIYLGRPACPWCRRAIPVMLDAAKENKLNTIYYYDIEQIRNDNTNEYKKLVDTVTQSEEDEDFDPTLKRIVVPDFYTVKDGKIVAHHQNTVESHVSHKDALTNDQIKELKNIFKEMFEYLK
jgi:predicted bacteriocin transport accessory protein